MACCADERKDRDNTRERAECRVGFPVVISAPSGTGKTTVCRMVARELPGICYSVSATTRPPREGEVNGKDYIFLSEEEFKEWIDEDKFIEWAHVHRYYYGTPKEFLEEKLKIGAVVIMDLDVQGGLAIKKRYPDAVIIFLITPSWDELEARLRTRRTDTEEDITLRLANAKEEIKYAYEYDYLVVNDSLEETVGYVISIIRAEQCRVCRRVNLIKKMEEDV